jgi:uracil-DNA glycosylase
MAAPALSDLREQALRCRNCQLWESATQTVFGEGPADASVLFVGEQPGDQEDLQGRPFVGPAGQLFDRALAEAGMDRRQVYVTNAVKHFKFEPRGKRRIHQKPDYQEVLACKPWLQGELAAVAAPTVVALGATAAQSLMGRTVTIAKERGRFQAYPPERHLFVTVHPSYLLRLPDERAKAAEYRRFVDELRLIALGPQPLTGPKPAQASLF